MNTENEIDTSFFVQKFLQELFFIETKLEEYIDMKKLFKIKNLPDSMSSEEPASRSYVDKKFNDPSITKNSAYVDFNDKNLNNDRFKKLNSYPAIGEHATANYNVNQSLGEPT